jgi:cyclopropane fatty-acyl-phospholipid synthase-like methyltransferase
LDADRLVRKQFPRSSKYHADWIAEGAYGGSALWLAEWLTEAMELRPGMRVLDLGCGKAQSSVFLAREFGVEVWAVDLYSTATDNLKRIRHSGVEGQVFPFHADARQLPFAADFFDAILAIDCYFYFGTDDLYLNYIAQFLKSNCLIGISGAGLTQEFGDEVPAHLREFWTPDMRCLHSADWWRRHWAQTGIVDVLTADSMPDGIDVWLDWHRTLHPDNRTEIDTLIADQGRYLGYARAVGRKQADARLEPYCWPTMLKSMPDEFRPTTLLR